ncbi:MAG: twin-arginine translocase TatA/TatE family subunit [Candidatus Hodarchaeota archaeon]
MNLGLPEIGIIILIVLFLFGPDKIPEMARSLGKANREYQKALSGATDLKATAMGAEPTQSLSEDEKLVKSAKELGIETEGKTIDDISREILEKTGN